MALALQGDALAAVWHASAPAEDGSQVLDWAVYELATLSQTAAGCLPLSAGAGIAWLGFGEDGELVAYDTAARHLPDISPSHGWELGRILSRTHSTQKVSNSYLRQLSQDTMCMMLFNMESRKEELCPTSMSI